MKSSINKLAYTFLFAACSVLLMSRHSHAKPAKGQVRVKYGDFINVDGPTWNLNLKPDTSPILTFRSGNNELTIYQNGSKKIYQLTKITKNKQYELYASNNKIGILTFSRDTEYNETACLNPNEPFKSLLSKDLTTKIEDLAYSDTILDKSCEPLKDEDRQQLFGLINDGINPNTSYLVKCFKSEKFKEEMIKNRNFALVANKVLSSYLDEMSKIESGQSQLKIKCGSDDKAKYSPKETAIVFPIGDNGLVGDQCKDADQVFTHEFFHHSGLQKNEIAALDSKCAHSLDLKIVSNKTCESVYSSKNDIQGVGLLGAVTTTAARQNKKENAELSKAIANDIKPAEFVAVKDADIQEISNPTSTATYEASVERVHKAMSTNLEYMAAPLNRAIASTVSTARAETATSSTTRESVSKTSTAKSRLPASAKATDNEEYVVEEILADKYNVPVETIRAASAAAPTTVAPTNLATRAAAPQPTTRAPGEIAGNNAAPGGGEIAAGNSGGGGAAASLSQGGGVAGRSVSSGTGGTTRSNNSRLPASAGNDPLVEQLGQFNEVRGTKYRQIQERYDDPAFEPELKAKNIAIEYRQNNKTTTIGDTSDKRTLFRDDGKVLKKVTGAR